MKRENIRTAVRIDDRLHYLEQVQKRLKDMNHSSTYFNYQIEIKLGNDLNYFPNDFPNQSAGSKMICSILETMVETELENLNKELETL